MTMQEEFMTSTARKDYRNKDHVVMEMYFPGNVIVVIILL